MGIISSLFGGSANDMVFVPGSEAIAMARGPDGAVESCPAYATLFTDRGKLAAVGEEARRMRGRESPTLKVLRVTKQGGFPDTAVASEVLKYMVRKHRRAALVIPPPRAIFVCLNGVRATMKEAGLAFGARDVITLPPQMAAAIGADLPIERAEFQAVLVLERDWCAFAVISLSGLVVSFELTWGLDQLLEDVALTALATRGVVLDADALHDRFTSEGIAGQELPGWEAWLGELETGRATQTTMGAADLRRSARAFVLRLDWQHRTAMAALPAAKLRDATAGPVHFFGPYVRVPGLAGLMAEAFHRQVVVAPGAETAMVRGGQKLLRDLSWIMAKAK